MQDSDEEVDFTMDLDGECELCGSFDEEDEQEYTSLHDSKREAGEISQEDNEMDDSEIEHCVKSGNLDKLKRILKNREEDCKQLEKEVRRECLKEQKDKEMRQILSKLNKVSKMRKELRKSQASSRQGSPCSSPGRRSTMGRRTDTRVVRSRKVVEAEREDKQKEQRSEYSEVFKSFLNL